MANVKENALVICPYFLRFAGGKNAVCQIVCEGLAPGVESGVIFTGKEAMHQWTGRWCNTYEYGGCPLAAVLGGKE